MPALWPTAGSDAPANPPGVVGMNVGPRIEWDPDHYPRMRVWDSRAERDRYLYLHRLVAFAHGKIDDLWEEKHVHHINGDSWDNRPGNWKRSTRTSMPGMSPMWAISGDGAGRVAA